MEVGIKLLNLFRSEFIGGIWLSISFVYMYFESGPMQVISKVKGFFRENQSFRIVGYINFFLLDMSS